MNIDVGWLLLAVVIVRVSVRWVRAVRRRWNADQINAQVKAGVIPHRKAYGRAFPGRSSRPGRVFPGAARRV